MYVCVILYIIYIFIRGATVHKIHGRGLHGGPETRPGTRTGSGLYFKIIFICHIHNYIESI